ncbi:MAG: hypothetical protein B0W54_01240 [Cellvibrio sp. 79]|nr:MAG: hypothetical protein B0W54_01240 [Cellvibrio sp. 79]
MSVKTVLWSILITTSLFGGFSLIFHFGDWERFGLVVIFALFVGAAIAPEIDRKNFKKGWLLQIAAGAMAGIVIGLFFHLQSIELLACCSVIGGFLGWLAPVWITHIQIP